jgi:hypothetical protein
VETWLHSFLSSTLDGCGCLVSITDRLIPRRKAPVTQLHSRFFGSQNRSGRGSKKEKLLPPALSNPGRPAN